MQKAVYNLVFPDYCNEITIAGYRFTRIPKYQESLQSLYQNVDYQYEFHIQKNTGTHAITAYVDIPQIENKAHLPWADKDCSALEDILFFFSLFTGREVFALDVNFQRDIDGVLIRDPRLWYWGSVLRCSIPYKGLPIKGNAPYKYNIGFQEGINKNYTLICSKEWQNTYQKGYYLFLARSALRLHNVDDAFIHCWTIWEHLFALLNSKWMSSDQIVKLSSVEKISFILVFYNLVDIVSQEQKKKISEELVGTRNRLIHFGKFPSVKLINHADVFIRLTETIIAKSLELNPSNIFNTKERLDAFFAGTLQDKVL